MLKIGIIGLPNVGKSTLFNAITNLEVEAANYPFATISPNIGAIEIKDDRVDYLAKIFNSKRKVYNQILFVDVAGLVKGASKGEGLGNKFLSNIREVDALIHVVRLFDEKKIIHVHNEINPISDIETINLELILADIDQIQRWIDKNEKRILAGVGNKIELSFAHKIKNHLENNMKVSSLKIVDDNFKDFIKQFNFLTFKNELFVINVSELDLGNINKVKFFQELKNYLSTHQKEFIILSANLEYELSKLSYEEQKELLTEYGLKETGINLVSKKVFDLLNYGTYFTSGEIETRAWAFKKGINIKQAAGIIHSDFERGFIKAEVFKYDNLIKYQSFDNLKKNGLISLEGKDYKVKDGDICHFKFNV